LFVLLCVVGGALGGQPSWGSIQWPSQEKKCSGTAGTEDFNSRDCTCCVPDHIASMSVTPGAGSIKVNLDFSGQFVGNCGIYKGDNAMKLACAWNEARDKGTRTTPTHNPPAWMGVYLFSEKWAPLTNMGNCQKQSSCTVTINVSPGSYYVCAVAFSNEFGSKTAGTEQGNPMCWNANPTGAHESLPLLPPAYPAASPAKLVKVSGSAPKTATPKTTTAKTTTAKTSTAKTATTKPAPAKPKAKEGKDTKPKTPAVNFPVLKKAKGKTTN